MTKPLTDMLQELRGMTSESRNPNTMQIDTLSTLDMLSVINAEDKKVASSVEAALPSITQAVDFAVNSIKSGGRLIYIGAGTSGRLGVLDAVECRPTFSVPDTMVIGIIAGGSKALTHAVEGAEDSAQQGADDLVAHHLQAQDTVVGIAASGRTPYVIGALEYADNLGCNTVSVACNPNAPILSIAKAGICANVGPECITGSTRMKSGTAQKLILNMLSTATMIKLGKVYENLMVDVNASNQKLHARAIRIVMQATQCQHLEAQQALLNANNNAKLAILMLLTNTNSEKASSMLSEHHGHLRNAMGNV
ncbi:MAG: N-acetylmuramic acid 6-phosphate etherase [Glaciecola sp.]